MTLRNKPVNITFPQRRLICWLYAAGILWLSIMPASALRGAPELFPQQDKVLHALIYGLFAVLLLWAYSPRWPKTSSARLLGIVLLTTAYGGVMEILQLSLPSLQRDCSGSDLLADLLGSILGIGIYRLCASPRHLLAKTL